MVKNPAAMWETWVRSLGWKTPWRRAWQSTPVSLPGESPGQRSLAGYSPCGHKGSDMTEWLSTAAETTFWRKLSHKDKVLMGGISALIKELPESPLALSSMWRHSEKISVYVEGSSPWISNLHVSWSWTFHPSELWEVNICCFKPLSLIIFWHSSLNGLTESLSSFLALAILTSYQLKEETNITW